MNQESVVSALTLLASLSLPVFYFLVYRYARLFVSEHPLLFLTTGFYGAWVTTGFFFYEFVQIPSGIYPHINSQSLGDLSYVAFTIVCLLGAMWAGAAVMSAANGWLQQSYPLRVFVRSSQSNYLGGLQELRSKPYAVWLLISSSALLVLGVGPGNIFLGSEYLSADVPPLKVLGMILVPVASVSAGLFVGLRSAQGKSVLLLVALFLFLELLLLAIGSRRVALMPLLYLMGLYVALGSFSRFKLTLIVTVAVVPVLYFLALAFRTMPLQGVLPLFDIASQLSKYSLPFGDVFLPYAANNVLNGVPLTGYVASQPQISSSYFWLSVNPLPGGMVGWGDVAPSLRANKFIPYNALGELLNLGIGYSLLFFALLGSVLRWLEIQIKTESQLGRNFTRVIVILLIVMFLIFSTQYHLRSATRMIFYCIFLVLAIRSAAFFVTLLPDRRVSS